MLVEIIGEAGKVVAYPMDFFVMDIKLQAGKYGLCTQGLLGVKSQFFGRGMMVKPAYHVVMYVIVSDSGIKNDEQ